jgi:hypothetical protein
MWEAVFAVILEFYNELDPAIQVLAILGFLYLVKSGVIKIPTLIWKKDNKDTGIVHESCPNYSDFLDRIRNERSKGERITLIKYYDTIYDQMSLIKTTAVEIADLLTDRYTSLLDSRDITENKKSDALQIYKMIVDGALDDACGVLRKWVKRNGLLNMSDVEYQTYIHKRTEEAQKLIKKYIDRKYLKSQLILDRKEVYDANMIIFYEQVQTIMADLFVQIRAVSEKYAGQIKAIEEE